MAGKILLEVVTPEKLLLSQEVDEVVAPGSEGDFGVLPGHCHFLSTLRIGELRYKTQETWRYMSILWGYVEVTPARVTVMAEIAEKAEDIDVTVRRRRSRRRNSACRLAAFPQRSRTLRSVSKRLVCARRSPIAPAGCMANALFSGFS